ncbi:response regulator transcription factor [Azospirillum sp. TSO35-2]|uniref:LuxR C-terminal-related transcriptional regulator n=1 Tax=Azospirillum sp. TSO35-2 TaxID=716796 RepID=UPI001304ADFA|nr:response regulator transcription factor [Azospirillum sp. TSO35-2]
MSEPSLGLVAEGQIYREGIKALLKEHFPLILEAETAKDAAQWTVEPDLIVIDAAEEGDDSLHTALTSRFRNVRIVYMLRHASHDHAVDLIRHGAHGVLGPDLTPEVLVLYLRLVLAGQLAIPDFALSYGPTDQQPSRLLGDDIDVAITARERQILEGLAIGRGNKSIARMLGISEQTVKFYVKCIMRKLKVANRTQAAIWALSHGDHAVAHDMAAAAAAAATDDEHDDADDSDELEAVPIPVTH